MDLNAAREVLLDHARHPRNCQVEEPNVFKTQGECRNPVCGDHVRVFISFSQGMIGKCSMIVRGCTMCTAAASLMSERVAGQTSEAALNLLSTFEATLLGTESEPWPSQLQSLAAFSHLRRNRARIPCALIPWYALKSALAPS